LQVTADIVNEFSKVQYDTETIPSPKTMPHPKTRRKRGSDVLLKRRHAIGWSAQAVCEYLGMVTSGRTLRYWEKGITLPKLDPIRLKKLLDLYAISPEDWLQYDWRLKK
jgi:hypothetical protein